MQETRKNRSLQEEAAEWAAAILEAAAAAEAEVLAEPRNFGEMLA